MINSINNLIISFFLMLTIAFQYTSPAEANNESLQVMISPKLLSDLEIVRQNRILFSHHSVGLNIIDGIVKIDAEAYGSNHIRLASVEDAIDTKQPMLIHFFGGDNGDPKSKIDAFAATLRGNKHLNTKIAFMKFCFVDFNPSTNVDDLFEYYRNTIDKLKREFPEIRFAHITTPLTKWPSELKWRFYRLIGKQVWEEEANVKRWEFNRKLMEYYSADPIYDLATIESTTPSGQPVVFEHNGKLYQSLYPGYTYDNGHLNTLGQKIAGELFISFIAEGLKKPLPHKVK